VRRGKSTYREVLDDHRDRLDRLLDRRGVARLRKLYDDAEGRLVSRIAATAKRHGSSTYSATVNKLLLAQIRQGQAMIAARLAGELGDLSREAQVESLRGLGSGLRKLNSVYAGGDLAVPVEQSARFLGLVDKRRRSLLRMHTESMAAYGGRVVEKMEERLALSVATGEATSEAVEAVASIADLEWWQAERIVRTETAWAYNASASDGLTEVARQIPDLMQRWNEHVDDNTFAELDARVGVDSVAMHGQVAPPGGKFTMPHDTRVSWKFWGREWQWPPNRPNDRAVLGPWRPSWTDIPAWVLRGGKRVFIRGGRVERAEAVE
jgi:hypothetical protein